MKRKAGSADKMVGIIFAAIGIFFVIVSIAMSGMTKRFAERADKIMATISDIETYRDSDGDRHHRVTVTYVKDGEWHEVKLSNYNSSMDEGDEIEILVDGTRAISASGTSSGFAIMGAVGALFAGIGIALAASSVLRKRKQRKIMENGNMIWAEVTGGVLCRNVSVNGRHPYKLDCKYEDVFSGSIYMFRSDYLWEDPELYVGRQIKVYTNPNAMNEYYVDVDSLQQIAEATGEKVYDFR